MIDTGGPTGWGAVMAAAEHCAAQSRKSLQNPLPGSEARALTFRGMVIGIHEAAKAVLGCEDIVAQRLDSIAGGLDMAWIEHGKLMRELARREKAWNERTGN